MSINIYYRYRKILKDLVIALSWANLFYFGEWFNLMPYPSGRLHYETPPVPVGGPLAVIAAVFTTSVIVFCLFRILALRPRRWMKNTLYVLLVVLLLIPLSLVRDVSHLSLQTFYAHPAFLFLLGCCLSAGLFAVFRWRPPLVRAFRAILMSASPFLLVTFYEAIVSVNRPVEAASPFVTKTEKAPVPRRVIWFLFDEMDYRQSFSERPADLHLEAFDRLAKSSWHADQAYPPAGNTARSIPAYLSGKRISRLVAKGDEPPKVFLEGKEDSLLWSQLPTVITDTQAMGRKTAVVGWFHDYCEQLTPSADDCSWESRIKYRYETSMTANLNSIFARALQPTREKLLDNNYRSLLAQAKEVVTNPEFSLVYVHWPAREQAMENLALADRTLGEMRKTLENAKQWEDTTIIVSAAHFRHDPNSFGGKPDHRVPFLIKLPGQASETFFHRPFNTVGSKAIIHAILEGRLDTPEKLSAWVTKHPHDGDREWKQPLNPAAYLPYLSN